MRILYARYGIWRFAQFFGCALELPGSACKPRRYPGPHGQARLPVAGLPQTGGLNLLSALNGRVAEIVTVWITIADAVVQRFWKDDAEVEFVTA